MKVTLKSSQKKKKPKKQKTQLSSDESSISRNWSSFTDQASDTGSDEKEAETAELDTLEDGRLREILDATYIHSPGIDDVIKAAFEELCLI